MNKLKKLTLNSANIEPNSILRKNEMKNLLGGSVWCFVYYEDVTSHGECAGPTVADCMEYCVQQGKYCDCYEQ